MRYSARVRGTARLKIARYMEENADEGGKGQLEGGREDEGIKKRTALESAWLAGAWRASARGRGARAHRPCRRHCLRALCDEGTEPRYPEIRAE